MPHEFHRRRWDDATSDRARRAALEAARAELRAIRTSRAGPVQVETLTELHARIVAQGEGFGRRDVAVRLRTSEAIVARARREAGHDEEWGRPVQDARTIPRVERQARVRELAERMNAREISRALSISHSTVLRDLGRKR